MWERATVDKAPARSAKTPALVSQSHPEPEFPLESRKVVIFGGKGGVGKTTAAASFALALAKNEPKRRILVFSTDPAHSLSDSFNQPIDALKKEIAGVNNLDAMEIDPGRWFRGVKTTISIVDRWLFASLSGGSKLEIKFDRKAMRELVELTPPGIDEIAALSSISDLLDLQSTTRSFWILLQRVI